MKRESIRAKALELFRRLSFQKTSVSDIAKACNMGKGTLYLYFANKDEILTSILEDRSVARQKTDSLFYADASISLEEKIRHYFDMLIDEYFLIKDLLFGSFEDVQGRTLKEVFLKFGKHYLTSIDHLYEIVVTNSAAVNREDLRERLSELMELLVGRMMMYVTIHEWNDRDGLKKLISPLSVKLYATLVA